MRMLNVDSQKRTWSRRTSHFCKSQPVLNIRKIYLPLFDKNPINIVLEANAGAGARGTLVSDGGDESPIEVVLEQRGKNRCQNCRSWQDTDTSSIGISLRRR